MIGEIHFGDCRESLRAMAAAGVRVQTCVTSPPYFGLRDYGHKGQIGLEKTPEQYVAALIEVFRVVRDVLRDDGTLWINIGDSYGKGKQLLGIPWRVAFALQTDGWVLRQEIIWAKPNPMPESVRDRCTKAHEQIFLLSKSQRYFYDSGSIREPVSELSMKVHGRKYDGDNKEHAHSGEFGHAGNLGGNGKSRDLSKGRNKRSVWTVAPKPYVGAHFAVYPPELIEPCILAGSRPGDIVLDPFFGSGTTGEVAILKDRQFIGCELNPEYEPLQHARIAAANKTRKSEIADAANDPQIDMFTTKEP